MKQKRTLNQKMMADAVRLGHKIPFVHALVELDVTHARTVLKAHYARKGEKVSLTAYIMLCCADAIAEDRSIQAMNTLWGDLDVPEEVDFFMPIEKEEFGQKSLVMQLIRKVNDKDVYELDEILQKVKDNTGVNLSDLQKAFLRLPWFFRSIFYSFWMRIPKYRKRYFGTVYFSSIMNYSADRRTWGVPLPLHSMGIFIGTVSNRLIQTRFGIEKRQMLQITVSVDHRISNGGDMGRFVHRLKYILEKTNLLQD